MNERTIFAIDAMGEQLFARIVRTPFAFNGETMSVLPLRAEQMPGLEIDAAVLKRGRLVRDALRQHQGISGVLDDLGRTLPNQISPLFVQLSPSEAELISWETLCDTNEQFVALDPRWPIARIIDPIAALQRPPSQLSIPIRLMAVISALGIRDQRKEWEQLRNAVLAARAGGLRVKLKVLIGDSALHASVQQEIRDGLTETETGPIEQTPAQLTQSIRAWSPTILHFFCHGQADTGGQSLELATANDHLQHAANNPDVVSGSVRVTTQNLVRLGGSLDNPWLLVLNCCSSGKAGVGLQSMANQVVSTGFPAVVAMMEPVDANDAYEFTRAFYPEAFTALRQASDELQHRASTSLEWTSILYHARTAISQLNNRDAQACAEWSLPVLYVRGLDAHLFIRPLTQDGEHSQEQTEKFRRQAEMAAMWLRTAGQQMSENERLQVMRDVLAAVPRELWPSLDGRFDHDDRI